MSAVQYHAGIFPPQTLPKGTMRFDSPIYCGAQYENHWVMWFFALSLTYETQTYLSLIFRDK